MKGDVIIELNDINNIGKEEKYDDLLINLDNNPLKEIPELKMRLYVLIGLSNNTYFDKREDLEEYLENNKNYVGDQVIVDYLGKMADMTDVIRMTYSDDSVKYFSVVDCLGYGVYNEKKSIVSGKYTWEYEYGDLKEIYNTFKKYGIKMENDVYGQIDELYYSVSDSFEEPLKRK